MKEIDELNLPGDIYYSKEHEWAAKEGDIIRIGISDYAQDQLGDIVYWDAPLDEDATEVLLDLDTPDETGIPILGIRIAKNLIA